MHDCIFGPAITLFQACASLFTIFILISTLHVNRNTRVMVTARLTFFPFYDILFNKPGTKAHAYWHDALG